MCKVSISRDNDVLFCRQAANQERQRVSLAAQVLSETVGRAIQHCLGDDFREQAEFVLTVDRVFDTLSDKI